MGTLSKRRYRGIGKSPKKGYKDFSCTKKLKYCDRLKACKLTSLGLHYRRLRGDMIETYKIVTGKCDPVVAPTLSKSVSYITRGNNLRLQKHHTRYDLRKYYFNNRVVNLWNSLPNRVLMSDSTNIFKNGTAFGKVKILFMTLEHNCMESEVDLRYVLSNVIE